MYFPVGWPKVLKVPQFGQCSNIKQITCNRDRILFCILTNESVAIWFCKPCVPIVFHRRESKSLEKFGTNVLAEWKPDSSMIVIATSEGHLLFYKLGLLTDQKGVYIQTDSPYANLRRDSAELFIKETIPSLSLNLAQEVMVWDGQITGVVCITMSELMLSTMAGHVLRYRWDGTQNRDYNLDLRRIPFCINQQVSKAIPIVEDNTYILDIEYSPLVGGYSIILNDGRAAFLTASSLKFDPNQVQGIWAQGIEDATCTTMNHKYRLITFGRANSECIVYYVDETTGGLEVSHNCVLSSKDYPGDPGKVCGILWTPDGCALVASWSKGGIALWSTFGALLMCSLGWDYGDVQRCNPLKVLSMQFATEGYQLWIVQEGEAEANEENKTSLIQLDFVKSVLTSNPCQSHQSHLYLQGEDKLYVNSADSLIKMFSERSTSIRDETSGVFGEYSSSISSSLNSTLAEGRQWLVIPVPSTYSATNWPIRYSAIDVNGENMAIAGRTGIAHYSMLNRRWKLFGNESQEKDFIVTGGLLWWKEYLILGCYSILENTDEIRLYARDSKLDNKFAKILKTSAPILLINILDNQLITFDSNAHVYIWQLEKNDSIGDVNVIKIHMIDTSALAVHPACITSITLTSLKSQTHHNHMESIILNVSGRLLMVHREMKTIKSNSGGDENYASCSMPTVLASCVENVWVPLKKRPDKVHLTEALWLFCGSHGMRVWLPLYPPHGADKTHTFMSKRIMLPFHLKIYPLTILFEDAIILGAENDSVLYYSSDKNSPFSYPFSILQRTSQVYLHQILRQLIERNLGYHAWEIAKSCMSLPYFPHSLELLLHEVLEEEATSKEPIPDAQLPSILEFIMEFPLYHQTVVQCARKTEIALWPYLFSAAGKPKDLFQECLLRKHLDTAASYLIILQNLETSNISRQLATILLNTALEENKWELAKDLVRFLRAIDPNDVFLFNESISSSLSSKQQQSTTTTTTGAGAASSTVSPINAEDLSLILGNVQGSAVARVRSFSTTISPKLTTTDSSRTTTTTIISNNNTNNTNKSEESKNRKKSVPNVGNKQHQNTAEEFFIDVILHKHARRLLSAHRLVDLGYFAAYLDFHLVACFAKERERAARIDDFILTLKQLHEQFVWPYPSSSTTTTTPTDNNNGIETEKLKFLKLTDNGNSSSSGYMSFEGISSAYSRLITTPANTLYSQLTNIEIGRKENDAHKIMEEICGESSLISNHSQWGDNDDDVELMINNENWQQVPSNQILEHLSNTSGEKGSHRSEIQLRYLLQLFMEASCLEWSLLISVLLRDAMAVLRTVNAAKSPNQTIQDVSRLRQGLVLLIYWTDIECMGYKTFMLAIQNQISVLTKILETKIQQQQKLIESQQQAVSTTSAATAAVTSGSSLNKIPSPSLSLRSRKTTPPSSTDIIDLTTSSSSTSISAVERNENLNNKALDENQILPDSTGCILS